jgi:hypothetical protein
MTDKTTTTYWNCCDELDEHLLKTFPDLVKKHKLHIEHSGGYYFHYCLATKKRIDGFYMLINPSDESVDDIEGLTNADNQEVICTFRSDDWEIEEPFTMPSLNEAIKKWYNLLKKYRKEKV